MINIGTQKVFLGFLLYFVLSIALSAQSEELDYIGVPFVDAYDKETYKAGIQNWAITQDKTGIIYIANNDGLLVYDGSDWSTYYLPNRTLTRSLCISDDGKIFVGGQNEFGYFQMNSMGGYTFHSLSELFDDRFSDFEDVWNINTFQDKIFFRSSSRIYEVMESETQVYDDKDYNFLGVCENDLYAQENKGDLLKYKYGQWENLMIPGISKIDITAMVPIDSNSLFVLSRNQGVYILANNKLSKWDTAINKLIESVRGESMVKITKNTFAIGTSEAGVFIVDSAGQLLSQISREEGLLSNKAQALFVDQSFNLWVGMNKGLAMIYSNSPFTRVSPDANQEGIGYATLVHNDTLYLATDNGLYFKGLGKGLDIDMLNSYQKIDNTDGQAWGLNLVNDKVFLAHNRGGYLLNGGKANQIYDKNGLWLFQEDATNKERLLIGGYDGLFSGDFENQKFKFGEQIEKLEESSRFVLQDENGIVWMAHPYRGIYKIDKKVNSVELLGKAHGLPSNSHNHVFKVNGQILFCAEKGLYTYNAISNQFVRNLEFDSYFSEDEKIRRMYDAPNGNIWFITSKDVGFLKVEDHGLERKIEKKVFPFLKSQMNDGFENIYVHDDHNVFLSTTKGFVHYNDNISINKQQAHSILLSAVSNGVAGEEVVFHSNFQKDSTGLPNFELPSRQRSIKFDFNIINFNLDRDYQYRWILEGFDEDWSAWSAEKSKAYTNLKYGAYEFILEAMSQDGSFHSITLPVNIKTPWYASIVSKLLYVLIFGGLVYFFFMRNKQQYQELQEKVEITVKKSEEEIKRIENERIKAALEHKQRELISTTMNLVKKNETFIDLKNNLLEIQKISKEAVVQKKIKSTLRLISQEENNSENWEQIMFHFNELNSDFVERLHAKHDKLTPKDIKMCTYLRMNLSTKEISQLLNVTIRAVEASRYRLRKKVDLSAQENLNEYFMRY